MGCLVATSQSAAVMWIPLGIGAFLVLWLPAFFAVMDESCPHCAGRFFGEIPARGSLPRTLRVFFGTRECRRCRIPIGTPKEAVGEWKPAPPGAAPALAAGDWRCACGTANTSRRESCRQCWAQRP